MRTKFTIFILLLVGFSSCAPKVACPAYNAEHSDSKYIEEKI